MVWLSESGLGGARSKSELGQGVGTLITIYNYIWKSNVLLVNLCKSELTKYHLLPGVCDPLVPHENDGLNGNTKRKFKKIGWGCC